MNKNILIIGIVLIGIIIAFLLSFDDRTIQGEQAPDFSLTDIEGEEVSLATFEGKPVVVWFTATYCVPCQIGTREMKKVEAEFDPEAFAVLMVFVDTSETEQEVREWQETFAGDQWHLAFGNEEIVRAYDVRALDTQVVIDREGFIHTKKLKPVQFLPYVSIMEELL